MLHSLIVGLGRSGRGLHLPALLRVRGQETGERRFAGTPIVGVDPAADARLLAEGRAGNDVVALPGSHALPGWLEPERTVVHLCTPPGERATVLEGLAGTGFRTFLIDKPLAVGVDELAAIDAIRRHWNLDVTVVAQWDSSALTERLVEAVTVLPPREAAVRFGGLRAVTVVQNKPRFARTQQDTAHPTAFDVEIPHSLALVLRLAGPGRLREAGWTDLRFGTVIVPRMGGAWLTMEHGRVRSRISSDLMSPVRERRVTLEFAHATVIGHYPASDADNMAQLRSVTCDRSGTEVFDDDALGAFFQRAYARRLSGSPARTNYASHAEVVRLLSEAKSICRRQEQPATVST